MTTDSDLCHPVPHVNMTLHKGNKCDLYSRPLQAIHSKRANGKPYHPDWRGRRLHKKCFHEICRNWPSHISVHVPVRT